MRETDRSRRTGTIHCISCMLNGLNVPISHVAVRGFRRILLRALSISLLGLFSLIEQRCSSALPWIPPPARRFSEVQVTSPATMWCEALELAVSTALEPPAAELALPCARPTALTFYGECEKNREKQLVITPA